MSLAVAIPDWIAEQRRQHAVLAAQFTTTHPQDRNWQDSRHLTQSGLLTSELEILCDLLIEGETKEDPVNRFWDSLCESLRMFLTWSSDAQNMLAGAEKTKLLPSITLYYHELERVSVAGIQKCSEIARLVLIGKPQWNLSLPSDLQAVVWTVRVSPLAYLRAMWNLFWSAIRHPLSDTTIDLTTGRVLYRT